MLAKHRATQTLSSQQALHLVKSELETLKYDLAVAEQAAEEYKDAVASLEEGFEEKEAELEVKEYECEKVIRKPRICQECIQELEHDLQDSRKVVEEEIEEKKACKNRSKALYKVLVGELKTTHGGNAEGFNEIMRTLHRTFGVHLEDQGQHMMRLVYQLHGQSKR